MQCLEAATGWGASWCSQLEDPHMASPWDVHLVTTWWPSSKGKKEREQSELLEKAGISLGVVRAAKTLSTNLLVLEAAYL